MTKPDGPLTKAGMRLAARYLDTFADCLRQLYTGPDGSWYRTSDAESADEMQRLSRQLYAKAREPKT